MKHMTDHEIQAYLDGGLPNHSEVERHLKNCQHCQTALTIYKQLFYGLNADQGFMLSANFADEVVAKVEHLKKPWAEWLENGLIVFALIAGLAAIGYFLDVASFLSGSSQSLKKILHTFRWLGSSQGMLFIVAAIIVGFFGLLDRFLGHTRHRPFG